MGRLISLMLLILTASPIHAEVFLRFGVYTSDKPTEMVSKFRPVLNALERRLTTALDEPVRIRLKVAASYDQGIEDLVSGKVDFARMGPASYVISKQRNTGLQLLAMESQKGNRTFFGIICVHEQSLLQTVGELKGRTFAFGDKHSTIGRYLSQYLLTAEGVRADDLAEYQYLDRHDRVGAAVGAGQFDAGSLKESTFRKLQKKGIKIRELARFPNVTKPWIAGSHISEALAVTLKEVLLTLKEPAALSAIKKEGFLSAVDSDYDIIRESIQSNRDFFLPGALVTTTSGINQDDAY